MANAGDEKNKSSRTRRRRATTSTIANATSFLQRPETGKWVTVGVIALSIAYMGGSLLQIRNAVNVRGLFVRGMSKTDTRYIAGKPEVETQDYWGYASRESRTMVAFDQNQRLLSVRCDAQMATSGCSPFLSIGIGTSEDKVWTALGTPDRQSYEGETKNIAYDGLGVEFALERFVVKSITMVPRRQPNLLPAQIIRLMTP
jgi:hypothetical protein